MREGESNDVAGDELQAMSEMVTHSENAHGKRKVGHYQPIVRTDKDGAGLLETIDLHSMYYG